MGTMSRAFRNIWRKKTRTMMVIGLLAISLATMISVFSTIDASEEKTGEMISNMETTLLEFEEQAENDILLISIQSGGGRMFMENSTTTITESEMDEILETEDRYS